jgi:hypothetical protein
MEITLLFAGFMGGVIRGLVGYLKYQFNYKNVPFKWPYFLMMVGLSGVIGLASGWLVKGIMVEGEAINVFYTFLAGYAGGDFIENAYKIIFKKTELFKIPQLAKVKS